MPREEIYLYTCNIDASIHSSLSHLLQDGELAQVA